MKNTILLLPFLLFLLGCGIVYETKEPLANTKSVEENITEVIVNATNESQENITESSPAIENVYGLHPGNLTIYFLDQHGFSAAITTPDDKLIVMDAGSIRSDDANIRAMRDLGYLNTELLVISSMRSYRLGGVPLFTERLNPRKGYYSGIGDEGYEPYRLIKGYLQNFSKVPGDRLELFGDLEMRFIVPYDDGTGFREDGTQNSMMVKMIYKSFSILFASDCYDECEDRVSFDSNLSADVLALPLLGRCEKGVGTSTYFLKTVHASLVEGSSVCDSVKLKLNLLKMKLHDEQEGSLVVTSDGTGYTYYIVRRDSGGT